MEKTYKAGETIVVNNNSELLAVKVIRDMGDMAIIVQEPDGHEFVILKTAVISFTNRYTIQVLEDLVETMKVRIKR
jgi:hypothetical protein